MKNYKYPLLILLIGFMATIAAAQDAGVGQWRDHLPFSNFIAVTETPDEIYGAKDPLTPLPSDGWSDQLGPLARQVSMDQSRHYPMLDEASKFTRLLLDFIDAGDDLDAIELKEQWRRRTR